MLRLHILKYFLNERYANQFLERVSNDPRLLKLCGLSRVPSEVAFSRFKNHRLAPHQEDLNPIMAAVFEECAVEIEELRKSGVIPAGAPALGAILAVDATDIPAYANPRRDTPADPGAALGYRTAKNKSPQTGTPAYANPRRDTPADPGAALGYRTAKNKSPQTGADNKELFFGYGADVISDAHYGLPLYINVRPAKYNEGPRLRADLDAALKLHPWLTPRYLTADKGYHAWYNFQHITDLGITPVIAVPRPPEDKKTGKRLYEGLYNEKGLPVCFGGQTMDFLETDPEGKHRFRCPDGGCHLKGRTDWSRYCDFEYSEKPEGKRLRIMGTLHRASAEWKGLFRKRTSIERWFASAKHSRLLDRHQFLGQKRVSLHATMSVLAYLLTALGRLRAGDYKGMQRMSVELP